MNAKRRSPKLRSVQAPSALEIRRYNAAQARSPRELAKFERFIRSHLRRMKRGEPTLMLVYVVGDPVGPGPKVWSQLVQGPPWNLIES